MSFHIAYAYRNKLMNEQEFALFYDANKSINAEFPYWNYERFYLEEKPTKARLYREDIYAEQNEMKLTR